MPWYAEAISTTGRNRAVSSSRARHNAPHSGPSLRTTVVASAAAAGAVATGTLTALVPSGNSGIANAAMAEASPMVATLAANSAKLPVRPADSTSAATFFTPVDFGDDDGGDSGDGGATPSPDQHIAMLGKAADLAAQLAQQHQAEALRAQLDSVIANGGLDGWIAEALRILDLPQSLAPSVKKIIMAESGGNPNAVNRWDANARRGTPSQGLMQTIPVTFAHYVHPSLADRPITDPVANITAGVRYMIANYGIGTLEAGGRMTAAGTYVGY